MFHRFLVLCTIGLSVAFLGHSDVLQAGRDGGRSEEFPEASAAPPREERTDVTWDDVTPEDLDDSDYDKAILRALMTGAHNQELDRRAQARVDGFARISQDDDFLELVEEEEAQDEDPNRRQNILERARKRIAGERGKAAQTA